MLNEKGIPIRGANVKVSWSDAVSNYDPIGYRYHANAARSSARDLCEIASMTAGCYQSVMKSSH